MSTGMNIGERIEAAVSALRPIVYGEGSRTTPRAEMFLRKEAEAALRAAFPDIFDGTACLVPMPDAAAMGGLVPDGYGGWRKKLHPNDGGVMLLSQPDTPTPPSSSS